MFGSKKSTDKCYINEWTLGCSNICSCLAEYTFMPYTLLN